MTNSYSNVKQLLDSDMENPMEWEELDDELWMLLSEIVVNAEDLQKYPKEISIYLATRYLEWEVGNGGFAQAAFNIPNWFAPALEGYRYFGKEKAAALISEALSVLDKELESIEVKGIRKAHLDIQEVFNHFSGSDLSKLDDKIPEDEWWSESYRIEFVRENRDIFSRVTA